jgi:hypothetical protein
MPVVFLKVGSLLEVEVKPVISISFTKNAFPANFFFSAYMFGDLIYDYRD